MYCPRCGARLTPDGRFCASCGNAFAPAAFPSSAPPPQKLVVVAKEGCFLQTLNCGCQIVGFIVLAIVLVVLYASYCQK